LREEERREGCSGGGEGEAGCERVREVVVVAGRGVDVQRQENCRRKSR
jgi:hypothetical protein